MKGPIENHKGLVHALFIKSKIVKDWLDLVDVKLYGKDCQIISNKLSYICISMCDKCPKNYEIPKNLSGIIQLVIISYSK